MSRSGQGDQGQLTKTIIVTGFNDLKHHEEVRDRVKKRFEVKESYTIQNDYRVLCILFYDERKAREAISYLKESEGLSSYHIISKYEIPRDMDKCDESRNQSTLLFTFKNLAGSVDDKEFSEEVCKFGEVKDIRYVKTHQRCVEFYDSRSAVAAFHGMNELKFMDGVMQAKWVWDLSTKTRWELIRLTDSILKECKLEIKTPTKRESEDSREEVKKKRRAQESSGMHTKNIFLQRFDAFIASNIDYITEGYISD
ncbi:hypothetical protein EHEL_071350 [Encephalitozoon hellem ATCC 50504]|uniref:RRM domain-containing protein n=1 Tax=Encephalitozoon hellem TaxID=27973 RepID=A0A9Q9C8U5_ENCHE|nr:uncharacterized protein EHEL_071350 [Encephalitozoon hellem ATCC 50504]AFM98661.1 hypothetical protein EHEL_071350 [Encephalitozoon hellem ATCC 50504]UTX43610.1 RRM domain-containing protein [Encephalitozoon hellem]WEL39085.1 RRM domain-containing protein [Encephalitozoon hellem]|eukprot:XP_003887642.1 hypothetical protein EHEL_071350 [Encephalitozoon hellem ATCC 50504]